MLQHAPGLLVGATLATRNYPPGEVERLALLCLAAGFITLAIIVVARAIAHWGQASPVPESSPSWIGPDPSDTAACIRDLIDQLRGDHGLEALATDPIFDELARYHAHDMVVRGFCGPTDPDGIGLDARLVRLHPTVIASLSEWDREVSGLAAADPKELADLLLSGPSSQGAAINDRALAEEANFLGIGVGVAKGRATVCILVAHHWASLLPDRPHTERQGTWPVVAKLVEGTSVNQLEASLLDKVGREIGRAAAERVDTDEWEQGRVCVYLPTPTYPEGGQVQWRRLRATAVALPLP